MYQEGCISNSGTCESPSSGNFDYCTCHYTPTGETLPSQEPHIHRHSHPHRGHLMKKGGRANTNTNSRWSGRTPNNPKGKPKK